MRKIVFACLLTAFASSPVLAQGEVAITQAKASAGGITPGDTAGYPITISQSGSYVLASNLTVPANQIGIQITARNVSIDLNGFSLIGAGSAIQGIFGNTNAQSVTLRNGTIERFKSDGIYGNGDFWNLVGVHSINNGRFGVVVGRYAHVVDGTFVGNGSTGLYTSISALVQGNVASDNGSYGIRVSRSTVLGNTISHNQSYGIFADADSGFGDNTLLSNNNSGAQVSGAFPLQPNHCSPSC